MLTGLIFAGVIGLSSQTPSTEVLAAAKEAASLDARAKAVASGLRATGEAEFIGVKGKYTLLFGDGPFVEEIQSELPQTTGWDGKTGWQTDWSKTPRVVELEDLEAQQAVLWVWTGKWLAKDSPFTNSAVVGSSPPQVKIKLTNGILEADVFLDEKHRPAKMVRQSSAGEDVYEFKDYKQVMGFPLAHSLTIKSGGMTHTITIKSVEKAPTFVRNPYEPVLTPPSDTTFSGNAEVEVKRAFSGHLLVHPLVNGKDVGWFIFDSGAGSMVIDPSVADSLGLAKVGKIPAVGIGGVVEASFRRASTFQLGPMEYKDPIFVQFDLADISRAFGMKIAGLVGYDFISRCAMELDLSKPRMAIYDPKTYKLPSGSWSKLRLDGKHPVVEAKFEGDRAGLFRLDTGANNALAFHTPAVEKYNLLEGRDTRAGGLAGVGGMSEVRTGRLQWFELGGKRIENPSVEFSQSKTGPLADKYTLGNIGQRLLRPFTIVFDYLNRRIAFLPTG